MKRFEQRVFEAIRRKRLVVEGDKVLVSVSGGADSVALLRALLAWKEKLALSLSVVHFNHGLRGEESESDATFVKCLCDQIDVPGIIRRLHVKQEIETRKGESLQSVARDLRYEALTRMAAEQGFTKVALGHTRDDQMETILMWMIRGAGLAGLSGMPVVRPPYFVRPLLEISRVDVESYLRENQWPYRLDSSNHSSRYLRNRIRQELVPVLKQFNPNIVQVLSRQAHILRDEFEYLEQVASNALETVMLEARPDRLVINLQPLSELPSAIQRRVVVLGFGKVIRTSVRPRCDFVEGVLDLVNKEESGLMMEYQGVRVYRDYQKMYICQAAEESGLSQHPMMRSLPLSLPGSIFWPLTGRVLEACWVDRLPASWKDDPSCVYLDGDHFTPQLVVRQWKPGDAFHPFGMNGRRKKVQDFFSDLKVSRLQRSAVPLVVAPEGIVWLAGFRPDHRFRIMKKTTRIVALKLGPETPVLSGA